MNGGMSTFFQYLTDRYDDRAVYRHEMSMADLAGPLGFDSVWSAEHHFDGYTMCPNVMQFLTYMAGRTKHVQLGSMVVVLPWHDPIRLTEEVVMLDHLSGGRVTLGMGRGLGRIEFEGFQREMGQSRERFVEYGQAILDALETGVFVLDGAHRVVAWNAWIGRVSAGDRNLAAGRTIEELIPIATKTRRARARSEERRRGKECRSRGAPQP